MVMDHSSGDWHKSLAGALDWWREAGVEHVFADSPQQWIAPALEAEPGAQAAPAAAVMPLEAQRPRIGGERADWPQDLAGFPGWWLSEPSLDPGAPSERVPPRGPARPALMVLVEHPEREDGERLLSGPGGALLDAFLQAAGIDPQSVYFASALPRCTPLPDWPQLKRDGLGEVVAHHIALVCPERVILLGTNISPLLDHDPAQTGQFLPIVNHERGTVAVLVAPGLEALRARPGRKAALWGRWLDWTATG